MGRMWMRYIRGYESEEYVVMGYPDYNTMKATLEKDL